MVIQRFIFFPVLIVILLSMAHPSNAEPITATLDVLHLPLQEASNIVKSQLSKQGTVIQLPSRRMLLIQDDAGRIERARALLKQLDIAVPQLKVQVELVEKEIDNDAKLEAPVSMLPGGWVRIRTSHNEQDNDRHRFFRLRIPSGKYGRIEAGGVRAVRPSVRRFMSRYGVADTPDIALVPIIAGFDVQVQLINKSSVRLRILPWFERDIQKTDVQAKIEILPDLGSTNSTLKPPGTSAPIRMNIQPGRSSRVEHISIAEADTEVTVKLGETVTLAAANKTAKALGEVLLAHYSMVADRSFRLSLTVTQAK